MKLTLCCIFFFFTCLYNNYPIKYTVINKIEVHSMPNCNGSRPLISQLHPCKHTFPRGYVTNMQYVHIPSIWNFSCCKICVLVYLSASALSRRLKTQDGGMSSSGFLNMM